jgi:apolipoprotein N-acyltransferase
MSKRTNTPKHIQDRLSYLWLAVAAALFLFTGGLWIIPLAAWLTPLFLLRFVRTQRPLPITRESVPTGWLTRRFP